jgi:PAS domain S-box-containing protein
MARVEEPDPDSAVGPSSERALQETEEALERARTSLRAVLDASHEIVVVHRRGVVVYANDAAVATLGYTGAVEVVGRPFLDMVDPGDREEAQRLLRGLQGQIDKLSVSAPRRIGLLRRDGTARATEAAAMPIMFDDELATAVLATDVTDRERTLARLVQVDRLAALGTLCAGAAHEINNPLTYTLLNIEHTLRALRAASADGSVLTPEQVEEMIASLSRSVDGAMRVRELGRSLTMFARGGSVDRRWPVDVRGALESSIQMSMHEIRDRARLVRQLGPVPLVAASETSLGQVFINLLVNAAQSIPEGDIENNEVRVSTTTDEHGNAVIEVTDTGTGIAPESLPRIFEPFYTSRKPGVGTGLGLSISSDAIHALGGTITVTSAPGAGSTFRVVLPPSPQLEAGPSEHAVALREPSALGEPAARVLVVDDEHLVGDAIARALASECDVTHAASGREALALLSGGARFDLVLCDARMPDLSITALHVEVSRVAPAISDRFVFMTDGALSPMASAFLESVGSRWLEKPVGLEKLREIVRGCRGGPL